jgi:plastocyanin
MPRNSRHYVLTAAAVFIGLTMAMPVTAEAPAAGTVSGQVRFTGEIPKRAMPDDAGRYRPLLTVDEDSQGLAWAIAFLEPKDGEGHQTVPQSDEPPVEIQQEDFEFVPPVVGIRAGQKVTVGNLDAANHNVRTLARNHENEFNIITPIGNDYERVFKSEPSSRPIRLDCDIHPWMRGWVYVFDHPWFAVTSTDGEFRIDGVPPGAYTLVIAQPDGRFRAEAEIDVEDGRSLHATVAFAASDSAKTKSIGVEIQEDCAADGANAH